MKRKSIEDGKIQGPGIQAFKNAGKMPCKGSNVVIYEPTSKSNQLFEFELNSAQIPQFGVHTGFLIEGAFEKQDGATAAWTACTVDDAANVVVAPNWFDFIIKDIDIFHVNSEISPHDVPTPADAFLNAFLLAHMHKDTKRLLCPEPCHPGNGTTITKDGWKQTATSAWREYAKQIFSGTISFRYVPLFKFPFYQQANFVLGKNEPQALPLPSIGNLHIRVYFREGLIFKKASGVTTSYRFRLHTVLLAVEELRLSLTAEKNFLTSKRRVPFEGVTKLGMAHNIPQNVYSYTAKLNKIYLPEGLFIFCLPKTVIPGTYNFQEFADNVFLDHNIKSVAIYYGGKTFYAKSPTPHDLGSLTSNNKHFFDYIISPPFGVRMDPTCINYDLLKNGGEQSPYPHVYIDLTQGGAHTRLITDNDDGSNVQNKEFLDVALQFKNRGTVDGTYFVYYFYTDYNVILDMNAKRFSNIYNNTKLTV